MPTGAFSAADAEYTYPHDVLENRQLMASCISNVLRHAATLLWFREMTANTLYFFSFIHSNSTWYPEKCCSVLAEEMKGDEGAGYLSVESVSSAGHDNSTWMYWKKNTFFLSAPMVETYLKTHFIWWVLVCLEHACLKTETTFHNKQDNTSRLPKPA